MQGKTNGINHIEFWVSNLARSSAFYSAIFAELGWRKMSDTEFSSGSTMFYLIEKPVSTVDTAGPRHICFQADSRKMVEAVAKILKDQHAKVIRGPVEMTEYSKGHYTVDFRDPDGCVMEVAYTPNMAF
jgi:catechol 2,3-dioxygenase-like lactoylglutathione lyase family enzyme